MWLTRRVLIYFCIILLMFVMNDRWIKPWRCNWLLSLWLIHPLNYIYNEKFIILFIPQVQVQLYIKKWIQEATIWSFIHKCVAKTKLTITCTKRSLWVAMKHLNEDIFLLVNKPANLFILGQFFLCFFLLFTCWQND